MTTKEKCSCCSSTEQLIPKAGSGTVTHWICKKCVTSRGIEVLPEYLENIEEFGHWHRPTIIIPLGQVCDHRDCPNFGIGFFKTCYQKRHPYKPNGLFLESS